MTRLARALVTMGAALLAVPVLAGGVAAAPGDEPATTTTSTAPTTIVPAEPTTSTTAASASTSSSRPDESTPSTTTAATDPAAPDEPSTTASGGDDPVAAAAEDTSTTTSEPEFVILLTPDPTNTIAIDKTNTADGQPARDDTTAQPGDSYTYNLFASCSSINVDCVNLRVVDTFPADIVVDESSFSGPSASCGDLVGVRDVTYDSGTRTLTVVYIQPLANPPGALGKIAGTSDSCIIRVTLPADTPLEDGAVIANEATISADNVAESATDPSNVNVDVPRTVGVQTTKAFTDPSSIAGDPNATTTMQLGSSNQSSNSAEVTDLTIEDSTAATYDYLDVTAVTVTQYPADATQAQLLVCPQASAPCDDSEWVAGGTGTPPGPSTLAFPGLVPAAQVVGVRVVFTATAPDIIENQANGGTAAVDVDMALRGTRRSDGLPITQIPSTTTIDNTATSTVNDPGATPTTATDDATAQYQILPPTLSITPTKSFFADTNGNYQTDPGEHAVIGEDSGVSMVINARNASAFPISEIVITEPATSTPASEFQKFDPDSVRLTFPAGAANANVVVTYEGGATTTNDYPAPGPGDIALHPPAAKVTSITVTYTGDPTVDSGNTIQPGATAGLGVHGNLNDLVDGSDVGSGGTIAGIDNCADVDATGTPYPGGTGTAAGTACAQLPIEERNADTGGVKVPSQGTVPIDQMVVFTMTTTNNGNLPLLDLVVADPPTGADGTPPTPDINSVWYWGAFVGADVTPASMASRVTIEVYTVAGGWQPRPLDATTDVLRATYPDVIGVRGRIDALGPTESFNFRVAMTSRIPRPPGDVPATLTNCYGVTADTANGVDGEYEAETYCSPPILPGPITESAAINKAISPETLPKRIPGMTPQNATVTLQIRNTGTIAAKTLQITDNDAADTRRPTSGTLSTSSASRRSRRRPWARCATPTASRSTRTSTPTAPARASAAGSSGTRRRSDRRPCRSPLPRCAACASRSSTPPRSTRAT